MGGDLNIPTGCGKGGHLIPKTPGLFPLICEKRHHNPIEGFTNICSVEISKERGKEKKKKRDGGRNNERSEKRQRLHTMLVVLVGKHALDEITS